MEGICSGGLPFQIRAIIRPRTKPTAIAMPVMTVIWTTESPGMNNGPEREAQYQLRCAGSKTQEPPWFLEIAENCPFAENAGESEAHRQMHQSVTSTRTSW
jgi:hypothetical protein